ncbi:MAG TPA: hypothetical protein VFZ73_09140 [Gemmatimonadaceae bacterium]
MIVESLWREVAMDTARGGLQNQEVNRWNEEGKGTENNAVNAALSCRRTRRMGATE